MKSTSVSRTVEAPVDRLWALSTDLEHWPEVIPAIQRVEVLEGDEFAAGLKWRETRKMMGREASEVMWLTSVDPGRGYVAEADGPGVRYVSKWQFEPQGADRTTVTMTFEGHPTGAASKVFMAVAGGLTMRSVSKALRNDLDDLAAAAEAS